jgi:hypothetical protein
VDANFDEFDKKRQDGFLTPTQATDKPVRNRYAGLPDMAPDTTAIANGCDSGESNVQHQQQ